MLVLVMIGLRCPCFFVSEQGQSMQELKGALSRAEAEKSSLRETMVQTETLIKQARHEHEQEISEASAAAAADCEALQRKCNDLQLAVCLCPYMHARSTGQGLCGADSTGVKSSSAVCVKVVKGWLL